MKLTTEILGQKILNNKSNWQKITCYEGNELIDYGYLVAEFDTEYRGTTYVVEAFDGSRYVVCEGDIHGFDEERFKELVVREFIK